MSDGGQSSGSDMDMAPKPKMDSPLMKAMKNNPEMMKRMMSRY